MISTPLPFVAFRTSAGQSWVVVLKAAVAPSSLTAKAHLESWRAVAKTAEAPSATESWIPAMETEDAPACQRMVLPGVKWLTR
jgi:hypothetical protein